MGLSSADIERRHRKWHRKGVGGGYHSKGVVPSDVGVLQSADGEELGHFSSDSDFAYDAAARAQRRASELIETNPRYFDTEALKKDRSPIAKVLIACSAAATDTDA